MGTGLATYYDRLGRWNRLAHAFGYGGGRATLTVHRALADPRAGGQATFTRLHDVVLEQCQDLVHPRVLDAGCGLGGTMIALAEARGADCTGLTLSPSQAADATASAAQRGLADRVRAHVQSYDDPPEGPFDLIVAIESLAHSPDPAVSVARLARVLAPGGRFIVVDDMPEPDAGGSGDLDTFKAGWQCPVLWTSARYVAAFEAHGLHLETRLDLTPQCRPRSHARLTALVALNRVVRMLPLASLRQVLDSHRGGLALERLTRNGLVRYQALIARRPALQVS